MHPLLACALLIAAFAASTTATTEDCTYLGCYNDPDPHFLLGIAPLSRLDMTLAMCRTYCDGFAYAGLESNYECWCGDVDLSTIASLLTADADCNRECGGDPSTMCGGTYRVSLFACPSSTASTTSTASTSAALTSAASTSAASTRAVSTSDASTSAAVTSAASTSAASTTASSTSAVSTSAASTSAASTSAASTSAASTSASTTSAASTSVASTAAASTSAASTSAASTRAAALEASTTSASSVSAASTSTATLQASITSVVASSIASTSAATTTAASSTGAASTSAASMSASTSVASTTAASTNAASTSVASSTSIALASVAATTSAASTSAASTIATSTGAASTSVAASTSFASASVAATTGAASTSAASTRAASTSASSTSAASTRAASTSAASTSAATATTTATTGLADSCTYVGCYNDNPRLLVGIANLFSLDMTLAMCRAYCDGFAFAGLESNYECWCGDVDLSAISGRLTADAECNYPCGGDSLTMCGGAYRVSLYACPLSMASTGASTTTASTTSASTTSGSISSQLSGIVSGGSPLSPRSGWRVELWKGTTPPTLQSVTNTNSAGFYSFSNVPSGPYIVRFRRSAADINNFVDQWNGRDGDTFPGRPQPQFAPRISVSVAESVTVNAVVASTSSRTPIRGVVVGPNAAPLAGVLVVAYVGVTALYSAVTGADGTYVLFVDPTVVAAASTDGWSPALPPGAWTLRYSKVGYTTQFYGTTAASSGRVACPRLTLTTAEPLTGVAAGATLTLVTMPLLPTTAPATVTGQLTLPSGAAISNARVELLDGSRIVSNATTDAAGNYILTTAIRGCNYVVRFTSPAVSLASVDSATVNAAIGSSLF